MKTWTLLGAAGLALACATAAPATTLTFDSLTNGCYGDGCAILPSMTYNGQTLTYTESGYVLTVNTSNSVGSFFGAHISDGTNVSQTFNWHDGGDNLPGAYVTLTKVGGGAFNLASFAYNHSGNGLTVSAAGNPSYNFTSGLGTSAGFNNVTSVTFTNNGAGFGNNGLDDIVVTAAGSVPEPASWALLISAFGVVGAVSRRRRVRTSVTYA